MAMPDKKGFIPPLNKKPVGYNKNMLKYGRAYF